MRIRRLAPVTALAGVVGGLALHAPVLVAQTPSGGSWRQWGGPDRNFITDSTGLAETWPAGGPPALWSRPLGTGHSAILADEGRLYTMYRVGNGRSGGGRGQGPWDAEEVVVSLDAASGRTLWEHKYPSRREEFSFGAGTHSTPLIVGDRLFTIGTNKQMFAFDKRTGPDAPAGRRPGPGSPVQSGGRNFAAANPHY